MAAVMPAALAAQPRAARLAERVRVEVRSSLGEVVVGTLAAVERDTVVVRVHADSTARIALADVHACYASRGLRNRIGTQNAAASVGALLGGIAGGVIGASTASRTPFNDDQGSRGALGAMIGLAVGGAIGFGATSELEPERWQAVTLPSPGRDLVSPPTADSTSAGPSPDVVRAALLPLGTRVRVQRVSDAPDVIGSIVAHGDTMRVRLDSDREVRVPWSDVFRLSVSRGLPPRVRALGVPAVLGATVGALSAVQLLGLVTVSCSLRGACSDVLTAPVVGGLVGALIGVAVGEARREEEWRVVPLPPVTR